LSKQIFILRYILKREKNKVIFIEKTRKTESGLMARVAVMAVVLGASFMDCSALLHPPSQAFSAAPQLRAGASASLLQRVARPDLQVRRECVRACGCMLPAKPSRRKR
jgi:hypothetical protein